MAAVSRSPPEEDWDSSVSIIPPNDEWEWKRDISEQMVCMISEIKYSDPKDNHHCTLFDWLVDPLRTAEEFDFVIREEGPICLKYCKSKNSKLPIYFGKVAAEALAVKCPILEGSWECVAWNIVRYGMEYKSRRYGSVSTHLSDWIINMIGNEELCPNPNLRIQLMILLKNMVQVNNHNQVYALESVMSAFCGLSVNFVMNRGSDGSRLKRLDSKTLIPSKVMNGIPVITINNISLILKLFTMREYMGWDKKLSQQLINLKTSRISIILKDVSFKSRLNPTRYANPRELYSLIMIFKFIVDYVQEQLRVNKKNHLKFSETYELKDVVQLLHLLIERFSISCQMPQLITLTLSCIIDVLEAVLLCRLDVDEEEYWEALTSIEWMLEESINTRKNLQDHPSQCEGRFKYIRDSWYNMIKDEESVEYDNNGEIHAIPRSNCSLRELLEKRSYNMFTNICKIVYNEYFDCENESDFENEERIRIIYHGEILSDVEISSDSETSSDSDTSFVDLP